MQTPIVTDVSARAVNVPLEFPVKTSSGVVSTSPLVLIDLHTNREIVGWSYVFTYTPLALMATLRMVMTLGGLLKNMPLAPFDLDQLT